MPGFFSSNQYKSPVVSFLGSVISKVNVPVPVPLTVLKERSIINVVPSGPDLGVTPKFVNFASPSSLTRKRRLTQVIEEYSFGEVQILLGHI